MEDKEISGLSGKLSVGVALMCRVAGDRVPMGAPRVSLYVSGALGALTGMEAVVFCRAPRTVFEQDEYNLFSCLLLARMCSGVTSEDGEQGTEVNFEPQKLVETMDDFHKLTGRSISEDYFKTTWLKAIEEDKQAVDGLKSQFGRFLPQ